MTDPAARICANCRFWRGNIILGYRECDSDSADRLIEVTVDDDSNLNSRFMTRATFGCTDFQPKDTVV